MLLWIQPTWRIHIWNYFGVLQPWLEQWASVLVAQYHAGVSKEEWTNFAQRLKDLWFQKIEIQKPEVLELFYNLSHSESVAELSRLPQYQTSERK